VTWITTQMLQNRYRPAHILCGGELYWEYSDDKVLRFLDEISPRRARFDLLSQDFCEEAQQEEKWFGGKYSIHEIDEIFFQELETPTQIHPELATPSHNEWIATDFTILKLPWMESPKMIVDTPKSQVFWKYEVGFNSPRVHVFVVFVLLSTGLVREHPRKYLAVKLFVKLYEDAINAWMYPPNEAGLEAEVSVERRGLEFHFWGYGQHIERFITKVIEWLRGFEIKEERFAIIKEKYHRKLMENFMEPSPQAMHLKWHLVLECTFPDEALSQYSGKIEVKHVKEARDRIFSDGYLECLIVGNIDEKRAESLATDLIDKFAFDQRLEALQVTERHIMIPQGVETRIMQRTTSPQETQHCILFTHQIGPCFIRSEILTMLLVKLLEERFFDQLRTTEQLGYSCSTWRDSHLGILYLYFEIVSSKSPCVVRERIREFIALTFPKKLGAMDEVTIEKYIRSVLDDVLASPTSLSNEACRLWEEVTTHFWLWDRPKCQAEELKNVKKEDLLRFYHEKISPISGFEGKLPRRVVVEIWGKESDIPEVKEVECDRNVGRSIRAPSEVQYVSSDPNKIEFFKRRLPLWPDFDSR